MKTSFYSHGKLLITGEYLVLDGVTAFALPTKKGQWMEVSENDSAYISWTSLDEKGNCWYASTLEAQEATITTTTENTDPNTEKITHTLLQILNAAKKLNPQFLAQKKGYTVTTKLEFNAQWGLGSSSTLIHNIAQWASVNPFALLNDSFGGSGYDIACAKHNTPITYKRNGNKPITQEIHFDPAFKDHLFFIYLNQKQDSKDSIKHYQSLPLKDFDQAAEVVQRITNDIIICDALSDFEALIQEHEELISKIIKTPTVKSLLFPEYTGGIKSLGGWGGDFVLVTGTLADMKYFRNRGYHTIIPFEEMVVS